MISLSHVIGGESGDSLVVALLIEVVSTFLVVVGVDGFALSVAARTICVGSPVARWFLVCLFS